MKKILLSLLVFLPIHHAKANQQHEKIIALQQAAIEKLECEMNRLRQTQQGMQIKCVTRSTYSSIGIARALCEKDEQVTGGGGGGDWKTALTDSQPSENGWSTSRRDIVGPNVGTVSSHRASAICCKIIKPETKPCNQ